ncbi:CD3324 family protein [Clostridiaceae bacterium M8S5]|nr:CD3324 family protein [Clostridiaceae bacterium M8S5]
MSYKKACDVLPSELLSMIQDYIDGEYIYIPRKESNKKKWGDKTKSKEAIYQRNLTIYKKYLNGMSVKELSQEYYLSPKWIYKIIAKIELQ